MTSTKIFMPDYDHIVYVNKPNITIRVNLPKRVRLSETKLHIKASPLKKFLDEDCSVKRLYMFKEIDITTRTGIHLTNNKLPEILELDDEYSIKFSDIAGYDNIFENLDIELIRNNLPFDISQLWFEYLETQEEPTETRYYAFESIHDPKNNPESNSYNFYFKRDNIKEIKIYKLFNYKDTYYLDKEYTPNDYLNDVEHIIIKDENNVITNKKLFKPIEEYKGHDIIIVFKNNKTRPILYIKTIMNPLN